MSGYYNITGNIGNLQINEQPQAPVNQHNYRGDDGSPRDIIHSILLSDSSNYERLFSHADVIFSKNYDESEYYEIIREVVDKDIDSEIKKQSFLEKVAKSAFDIGKSIIGGILLQIVKNKVFGA